MLTRELVLSVNPGYDIRPHHLAGSSDQNLDIILGRGWID